MSGEEALGITNLKWNKYSLFILIMYIPFQRISSPRGFVKYTGGEVGL